MKRKLTQKQIFKELARLQAENEALSQELSRVEAILDAELAEDDHESEDETTH